MNWIPLTTSAQLEEILQTSEEKPVMIFKHSTTCSVSNMAKRNFEMQWNSSSHQESVYFLDLLQFRSVSNQIAETLDIRHESPQLIVVLNGKVTYHASHSDIDYKEALSSVI